MNEMSKSPEPASKAPAVRSLLPEFGGSMGWLRGEIDRLFDDFGRPGRSLFDFGSRNTALVPALEMSDEGQEYRLTAELPGLAEKDVDIELGDGLLTISGEKKEEEQERKEDGFMLSERRYGSFRRQIGLPSDVRAGDISARFKDGVLTITMPKDASASTSSRKIAIES